VDIGGVIYDQNSGELLSGAKEGICALQARFGMENVRLISKITTDKWRRTVAARLRKDFSTRSPPVHFVATQADKVRIMKDHGVRMMLDDSMEVIAAVRAEGLEGLLFARNGQANPAIATWCAREGIPLVTSWWALWDFL
jgi:acid phosphatase class B